MRKDPKKPGSGNRSAQAPRRGGDHGAEKGRGAYPDKTSKRGSFRKKEQSASRAPEKIPPRPQRRADKPQYDERGSREPRGPKVKADLFGLHAVREAWTNPKRYVHALYATESALRELGPVPKNLKRPVPVVVAKEDLDRAFPPGTVHQGLALSCQPLAEVSLMDIIIKAETKPRSLIIILDQVTDPHNVGAIMRSACAFGADGMVMQSRHAPDGVGILAKIACGAAEHVPLAYETNLNRAIETLQKHHYTVIGLDEHAAKTFAELPRYDRAVLVLGAEGPGMRRMVKEHCDVLVRLPTKPPIASLNVSNAAAVALYALSGGNI